MLFKKNRVLYFCFEAYAIGIFKSLKNLRTLNQTFMCRIRLVPLQFSFPPTYMFTEKSEWSNGDVDLICIYVYISSSIGVIIVPLMLLPEGLLNEAH